MLSLSAFGAEIVPSISIGLIQTDNLTLVPTDPESATVWHLIPAITADQDSPRLKARAAYKMEAYHYQQRGEDEIYNQFDGNMSLGLVPEHFFLDLGATHYQGIIDPESTIPASNLAISANREDVDQYYAGPTFRVGAGGNSIVNGSFRRTWVDYGSEPSVGITTVNDYVYDTTDFSVDNYMKGNGITWAARYDYRHSDFGPVIPPYEYRQASMEIGFWSSQSTRLFVTAGKESPWDKPLDPDLEDSFWEAGFARSLGEKFRTNVAFGERTFGKSLRAAIDYQFGRGALSVSYAETPTTTAADRSSGGLLTVDQPNDYLTRSGVIERYIENRFQSSVSFTLRRLTFSFTAFDEQRSDRTTIVGSALTDESQTGGIFSFGWKLGVKTDIGVSAERTNREFADNFKSELVRDAVSAGYALGRRTRLSLEYQHWEENSETNTGLDYASNVLTLLLSRNFR